MLETWVGSSGKGAFQSWDLRVRHSGFSLVPYPVLNYRDCVDLHGFCPRLEAQTSED